MVDGETIKKPEVVTSIKIPVAMKLRDIICLKNTDIVYLTSSTTDITIQLSYLTNKRETVDEEKKNYEMLVWNKRYDVIPMLRTSSGTLTDLGDDNKDKHKI